MEYNFIVKSKFSHYLSFNPTRSLAIRLALYFIIFAQIIGYACFILFIASTTHHFARSILAEQIREFSAIRLEQINPAEAAEKKRSEISEALKRISRRGTDFFSITGADFFYSGPDGWQAFNQHGESLPVPESARRTLNTACRHDFYKSSGVYFGQEDTMHFFLRLSCTAENSALVRVNILRKSFSLFARRNILELLLFDLALLVFSAVIGKIFTRKIAAPLLEISHDAGIIASGNFSHRSSVRRQDEIGILSQAMNSMAEKVEKNIRDLRERMGAIETMNRIDKAVLSSISRNDLLGRVMNIVLEMFPGTYIVIALRNKKDNGFITLFFQDDRRLGLLHQGHSIEDSTLSGDYHFISCFCCR